MAGKKKAPNLETVLVPGEGFREKGLAFLLTFVAGFAGFSIIGAILLIVLLALGILPIV